MELVTRVVSRLMSRCAFDMWQRPCLVVSVRWKQGQLSSRIAIVLRHGPGLQCCECTMFAHGTSSIVFDLVSWNFPFCIQTLHRFRFRFRVFFYIDLPVTCMDEIISPVYKIISNNASNSTGFQINLPYPSTSARKLPCIIQCTSHFWSTMCLVSFQNFAKPYCFPQNLQPVPISPYNCTVFLVYCHGLVTVPTWGLNRMHTAWKVNDPNQLASPTPSLLKHI